MTTPIETRLPSGVRPQSYALTLTPNLADFTFQGEESISIEVVEPTTHVTLHALELEISHCEAALPDGTVLQATESVIDEDAETATFTFSRPIPRGSAALNLRFAGTLNDQLRGFYRSQYVDADGQPRYLATTQFEATDARRAFPCWDEPAIKATFQVTLVVPSDLVAISNMPVESEAQAQSGAKAVRFAQSPRMSTYLVAFVVGRMSTDNQKTLGLDREDALAYGIEGLIQAVDNYDPERGTTFASFAIRRIRGSILDAIRRMDILPRSLRKSAREVERANLELAAMLGRWPTLKELSLKLRMPIDQVRSIAGHSGSRLVSLEKMMGETSAEGGTTPWEAPDTDELADPAAAADKKAAMQLLGAALSSLSSRDQKIVQLRYGRSLPFHEIGRLMNLSESRVCQLHKRILSSLHKRLKHDLETAA